MVIFCYSTKIEYRSLANVAAELVWICSLVLELRLLTMPMATLWCNNLSAVHLSMNPILHSIVKHVVSDIYFVRDLILHRLIEYV